MSSCRLSISTGFPWSNKTRFCIIKKAGKAGRYKYSSYHGTFMALGYKTHWKPLGIMLLRSLRNLLLGFVYGALCMKWFIYISNFRFSVSWWSCSVVIIITLGFLGEGLVGLQNFCVFNKAPDTIYRRISIIKWLQTCVLPRCQLTLDWFFVKTEMFVNLFTKISKTSMKHN